MQLRLISCFILQKVPLHLSYRIFESAPKRIKLCDNDEFKQSLSNINMDIELKNEDQSTKREWKEVQLKISETGVMSVTGISNLDSKKGQKINENYFANSDQSSPNSCKVNTTFIKGSEKNVKQSKVKNKKSQQDNKLKKNEKVIKEKIIISSNSKIKSNLNNTKNKEIELKLIDQCDISNEILINSAENKNTVELLVKDKSSQALTNTNQLQSHQIIQDKKDSQKLDSNKLNLGQQQNLLNNNVIRDKEAETEINSKQNTKVVKSTGSKINALSAKLQFQPNVGQVNNTYSKKSLTLDKKKTLTRLENSEENKSLKIISKTDVNSQQNSSTESQPSKLKTSMLCSGVNSTVIYSQGSLESTSSLNVLTESETNITTDFHQQNKTVQHKPDLSSENLGSIGLHESSVLTISNQTSLDSWIPDCASKKKTFPNKAAIVDQQLRSLPGMPQIGKEIVCSTTAASVSHNTLDRISVQIPSMSIYYSSPSKQQQSSSMVKTNYEAASIYPIPPCPDAIPISLMKSSSAILRKDAVSKGSMVNEICDKIRSSSKLNIESSKGKSKLDTHQRSKSDIPELLKIPKKNESFGLSEGKHSSKIPNVPMYVPTNSEQTSRIDIKDSAKKSVAAVAPSSQGPMMSAINLQPHITHQKQAIETSKQSLSGVSYKTLRYPPKNWNPTLSKNNYVAAKNHAKELQAYNTAADGSSVSRQIPSKPPKIFKNKNTPRFLGKY